jgi:hypothetical protein
MTDDICLCFGPPVDSCPTHGTREDETPTIPFIPPMEIVINEDGVMEFRPVASGGATGDNT